MFSYQDSWKDNSLIATLALVRFELKASTSVYGKMICPSGDSIFYKVFYERCTESQLFHLVLRLVLHLTRYWTQSFCFHFHYLLIILVFHAVFGFLTHLLFIFSIVISNVLETSFLRTEPDTSHVHGESCFLTFLIILSCYY